MKYLNKWYIIWLPSCLACRIHRLLLSRRETHLNKFPDYETNNSDGGVPIMLEFWGLNEYSFIAITPRSTLARRGSTWMVPIYGSNRTKVRTYAKLNCLKKKSFDIWSTFLCLSELFEIELFLCAKLNCLK